MNGNDRHAKKDKDSGDGTKGIVITAEYVFAAWMNSGGLDLVAERGAELRKMVDETIAGERARLAKERAELKAKNEAMEAKFAALGYPGGPPLDDAEQKKARGRGLAGRIVTPPADDETFRKMLVARILTLGQEHPNNPPATRGLARWSGAPGKRVKDVLKDNPDVTNTVDDRWVALKPAAVTTAP